MPPQAHLVARVAHQRDVAVGTRERLLAALPGAPGQVVLATCHRVELYEIAAEVKPIRDMRTLIDEAAAAHLLRVAAGLYSVVAGEPQILRQVGAACESVGGVHPLLRRLFERAVHIGREVRRSTRLGDVRRSVGSLAADEAVRSLRGADATTILVIGAGEMGKLAVRALSQVARVLVANRDRDRAQAVATANGAEALSLAEVPAALERAYVVRT